MRRTGWSPRGRRLAVGLITLTIAGCATTSGRREIDGFSVQPPSGRAWTQHAEPERGMLAFMKGYDETAGLHTVVAQVRRIHLAAPRQERSQLLHQLAASLEREALRDRGRYTRLAFDTSEDQSLGAACVRYSGAAEDRGVPGAPVGSVAILEVRGLRCAHPSASHLVVDISYSQRFPQASKWNPAFDSEVEPFIKSVRFAPLPVSERSWDPPRWQQTIVAAKQAKERGATSEAEQLCVEALQYVDANTVRSLYDYAALLQELKREGAEAAKARADKLYQAKTQPGSSVYLGWIPSTELQAYARLLQELDRNAEAEAMRALADAYDSAQHAHYIRYIEQARGSDPRGTCW